MIMMVYSQKSVPPNISAGSVLYNYGLGKVVENILCFKESRRYGKHLMKSSFWIFHELLNLKVFEFWKKVEVQLWTMFTVRLLIFFASFFAINATVFIFWNLSLILDNSHGHLKTKQIFKSIKEIKGKLWLLHKFSQNNKFFIKSPIVLSYR